MLITKSKKMKKFAMLTVLVSVMSLSSFAQQQEPSLKSNDISFDDILYWVGTGSHEAVFIVNWCSPEIAFAWGYRFDDDSILVSQMMEDIVAADSRIAYTDGGGYVTDITYTDSTYSLGLVGSYWMYNVNEGTASGIGTQYMYAGDIVEFGDESCGTSDTNWIYTWDIDITPVSNPNVGIINATANVNTLIVPNPAHDFIDINVSGLQEDVTLSIVDLNGKSVYREVLPASEAISQRLSIDRFRKGMYFIRLQGASVREGHKLIVY